MKPPVHRLEDRLPELCCREGLGRARKEMQSATLQEKQP